MNLRQDSAEYTSTTRLSILDDYCTKSVLSLMNLKLAGIFRVYKLIIMTGELDASFQGPS